ncbi:MAG: M14 family metallopeptidase [Bacteroidota bacterium]
MRRTLLLGLLVFSSLAAWAQPTNLIPSRFAFEPSLPYNQEVPSPAQFLGYDLGLWFTNYTSISQYAVLLANSSDRVLLGNYGSTYEGRPLLYMVISHPDNLARLEEIRQNNLKLADPVNTSEAEAQQIMENHPVVVSYSYSIHGNEASTTEAAMQVAYRMAAAQDSETVEMLKNMVFVTFLCINPDGRDRYVYWYNSVARTYPATDPYELEHDAPWPNGRTNHYWFDLNRDWLWGVHPESRGHTDVYQNWMPQVHVDYHEQGYNSNYFTMPGTTPRNLLLPDQYDEFADKFGRANIAAFDEARMNYFTREAFDFFYPGYGSSYPSVNGAIGMLTEQGGIGAGRAIETNDGYKLLLRQRIWDHYTTSIATLREAVNLRGSLHNYQRQANNPANSKSATTAYLLPDDPNGHLYDVLNILQHHNIRVDRLTEPTTLKGVTDYLTGNTIQKTFPEGTYIVPTNQSRHLLINSLLSREMEIEDSVMYDMSTWSAPLAYQLEAYSTTSRVPSNLPSVSEPIPYPRALENPQAQYAYVIPGTQRNTPLALSLLHRNNYRIRSATKAFSDGSRTYPAGSLIVLIGRNLDKAETIVNDMGEIAQTAAVQIVGMNSGRMVSGIDLASNDSRPLDAPRVAMLVEGPFNTYSSGFIYWLFDQELQYPISRIRAGSLAESDIPKFGSRYGLATLDDYDVLILPGGGGGLSQVFGDAGKEKLQAWIRKGGTVIATESAASFFTKGHEFTEVEMKEAPKDDSEEADYLAYQDRQQYYGLKRVPGTALLGQLDTSHPLAFGLPKSVYMLKFGNSALVPSEKWQTVGHYAKDASQLKVSGYISTENRDHLAGGAFAGVSNMGQGKIVYLVDNTQYRMFWRGTARLLINGAFYLPSY